MPNSRQVRWRFAQVAKIFGICATASTCAASTSKLCFGNMTAVMEEVLSKLFHERMDVKGATDVLRGLQSGAPA